MTSLSMPNGRGHNGDIRQVVPVMGLRRQILPTETDQDSPGADVLRRHPNLPDNVYRRVLRNAVTRETSFDVNRRQQARNLTTQEHRS